MHRLFIAIRPPEAICDLLVDAMDDSPELRWVGDELLHVTLRFVGEVERPLASDLAVALGRVEADPFELRISGIGRFDQKRGGALWQESSQKRRSRRYPPRSSGLVSRSD
jgi:2'-5' RNA ligase